jgi:putative transposase
MEITRANQVGCSDSTFDGKSILDRLLFCLTPRPGYLYLVSIMDWTTRKVPSRRVSNTMHTDFCEDALREAIGKYAPPEIMNTY